MSTTISGPNASGSVLWQGFDYGWKDEPHRVSRFGSHFDSFALLSSGQQVEARYLTQFGVGRINDEGDAITYAASLIAPELRFIHGYQTQSLRGEIGQRTSVSNEPVTVEVPQLSGGTVAVALLRGFQLNLASFDKGLQTRGWGVELLPGQLANNRLTFMPRFTIHPERSPDPFTREPFVGGPPNYEYVMTAYFTVVAAPRNQVHLTIASPETPTAVTVYQGPSQADEQVSSEVEGESGSKFPHGVVGIQGFRWHLNDFEGTKFDGRYLRRLWCFIAGCSYDPATGRAGLQGYCE